MAKFTVLFNNQPIQTNSFDKGVVHIGRDDINNIVLDSVSVAPAHTAVVIRKQGNIIKQLNADFPLIVNNKKTKGCTINNGDVITLGEYAILFNNEQDGSEDTDIPITANNTSTQRIEPKNRTVEGSLQIMEGEHIGRIIPLKKAMTRLGRTGIGGVVIISRRSDGYYISALDNENTLAVNGQSVENGTLPLNNQDTVLIDNIKMLFFV